MQKMRPFPALQGEIQTNEENIEDFHRKSVEIQEMLQSQEAPLELQVGPMIFYLLLSCLEVAIFM